MRARAGRLPDPAHARGRALAGLLALGAAVGLALGGPPALRAQGVPALEGRVNDYAGMIPADVEARLEEKLAQLEADTTAQVVVLTVDSLEGDSVESYALRVAEAWRLGQANADNGALLLVAKNDRKMRIEVGYGLEGELTDIAARRIIGDVMTPYFRNGDFGAGIEAGVDAIADVVRGVEVTEAQGVEGTGMTWEDRAIGATIFLVVVGTFALVALFTPGPMGWLLYVFLMPFMGIFPAVFIGAAWGLPMFLAWAVGFPIARRFLRGYRPKGGGGGGAGSSGGDPWWHIPAGTWSTGRSGGGFSGGGFSGGGGSFGGGGASGGW